MKKNILLNSIQSFSPKRGEGEGDAGVFTKEQMDAAISEAATRARDEATLSLSAKNAELLSDLKKTKESMKQYDGIDPDYVKKMMAAFENNQDLKDISEGKHEEVINRKIEKEKAKFSSELAALTEKTSTYEQENGSLKEKVSKLLIDTNVVTSFVKEKGLESGIEDVILRAKQVFKVEGDDLIPRDSKGVIIPGKDGAMTIPEWVDSLKERAPHLFQGSSGSGASGGEGGDSGTGIVAKIKAASASGNMKEYRRLRELQKKGAD